MEVSVVEFRNDMAKLIKENEVIEIQSHGKTIATVFPGKVTKPIQTKKDAEVAVAKLIKETPGILYGKYGCGCQRGEKKLCPKHGRA